MLVCFHFKYQSKPVYLCIIQCDIYLGDYCDHQVKVTLRKLLYQPDFGGNDYEEDRESATVVCEVRILSLATSLLESFVLGRHHLFLCVGIFRD